MKALALAGSIAGVRPAQESPFAGAGPAQENSFAGSAGGARPAHVRALYVHIPFCER